MTTAAQPDQSSGLEAALDSTAAELDKALIAASLAIRELKRARAAAAGGQVRDLRRSLDAARLRADELAAAVRSSVEQHVFDEAAHLASGAYSEELLAAAHERGLAMVEDDDRLLCYPSLVRILPGDAAIEIDRTRERRLRPSVVLELLAARQKRPPRSREAPFLESVLSAYELLAEPEDRPDPVLRLDAVWRVLTLLPGQARDYTRPEFARDLYLLDQSGLTRTRSGRALRWHASSGTRGAGVLTTVAQSGQQQTYWGLSFSSA